MPIEFSLKLKKHLLNYELLISEIEDKLGNFANYVKISDNQFDLDATYETMGFGIAFIKNFEKDKKLGYETKFLNEIFLYDQLLFFNFNKDFDREISYKTVLEFIFNIMKKINTEALLCNSFFQELCFFKNNKEVLINSSLEIWENINFYETIGKWDYYELNWI